MAKLYTKTVNSCPECPNLQTPKYAGVSIMSYNCWAKKESREIESLLTIPDWCPLEDKEE